mmetsp:Transcript_49703/g.118445  ORF Transcript_49703/g.118445 Transcript_49703/m.118445 type:complete len:1314 (+) Transcript_49703:70-4011(+)
MTGTDAVDVDEMWAEMQKEQRRALAPNARSSGIKVPVDISSLQRERQKPKKPVKALDTSLNWMQTVSLKPTSNVGDWQSGPTVNDEAMKDLLAVMEPPETLLDAVAVVPAGTTPETFMTYIQRDINCLTEDMQSVRQQSLLKLENLLVKQMDTLSSDIVDTVLDAILKPLLKRMKDKSEKCRELAVRILRSLIENASNLSATLPYVFPVLVSRFGCEDLDGVAHLPEVMRPNPEQRPTELGRPVEESEEVRLELARFVASLLARCSQTQVLSYIDEATGLVRAQTMDPFHEVKLLGCETMIAFCHNHTEMLLHFSEPMGRALTSCITHNHAKVRIASLRALTAVLWCGVWKHNHEILQILMAWQDPNKVSIKAFYEADTKVNYMSTLSFDRHPAVRRFWFETMAYWLMRIPDKVDHEPYIFPYLLTGLCDENEEIALECFWLIERCGELYEQEHESDLRKTFQYGFDYRWTYSGKAFVPFPLRGLWGGGGVSGSSRRAAAQGPDLMGEVQRTEHAKRDAGDVRTTGLVGEEVQIPARDYAWPEFEDLAVPRQLPRPRLGSRCWVRTHTRRYIKATFNDVVDFRDCTALNAGRLLCMSIAYAEEGVTEWLQPMLAAICKFFSGRSASAGDSQVTQTFNTVCKLLGSYIDPIAYWEQLKDSLDVGTALSLEARIANVQILALCIEGSIEVLKSIEDPDPELGMGHLTKVIPELISAMHASDLLLSPSDASRKAMWALLFSFLEPLKDHLSFAQVSQLLYVVLSLAAKTPAEVSTELAGKVVVEAPQFEAQEIVDSDLMERAMAVLSELAGVDAPAKEPPCSQAAVFSLDSMDDDFEVPISTLSAEPESSTSDPLAAHEALFRKAFPEVLARMEDSFDVFRSVMYLSPLVVLVSAAHAGTVVSRLSSFCSASSAPTIRSSANALGMHLALRCTQLIKREPNSPLATDARQLLWSIAQTLSQAQSSAVAEETLSYSVLISGVLSWRRFFLNSTADPRHVLFPLDSKGPARTLQWLSGLVADQELYKRFHKALEQAETIQTGVDKANFVITKSKQIREESEQRAETLRCAAASTLLLGLRRILQDGNEIPWASGPRSSSKAALWNCATSLFTTVTAQLAPPFVKPTSAALLSYSAEILSFLLREDPASAPPFKLRDDAPRAIHEVSATSDALALPMEMAAEDRETLVADYMSALISLNLSLPPDPEAKNAPVTLAKEGGLDIVLGWDEAITSIDASASSSHSRSPPSSAVGGEVPRLMAQSLDCQRWNAALAMYNFGVMLSSVCRDAFEKHCQRWQRRKELAKVVIVKDLLHKSAPRP